VGAIALLALAVADVTVYSSLRSYLYQQTDNTLQLSHLAIEQTTAHPPDDDAPPSGPGTSEFCQIGRESAPGMFIEVLSSSNKTVRGEVCPAFTPGSKTYSPALPTHITGFHVTSADPNEPVVYFTVSSTVAGGPEFRVRASQLKSGGVLVVADPIGEVTHTLNKLLLVELLVSGAALLGAILLGLWLVRVGLRPLRDVVRTADSISGGDLVHRVPNANTSTEVGHVSTALNVMLERIEESFAELRSSESRLRQFVSDASHELRTPIAAVSAYAQLFQRGASERGEDLPRIMEGIERETTRMARLVDDLLLLARFDEEYDLHLVPVELVGLSAEAVDTARLVGPAWPITFVASEPVEVAGDWSALRQVVDNLLANVRAHTPEGTAVTLSVSKSASRGVIEVADRGPGISEDDAVRVFERFVRTDSSRSRETGGAGLGLAIVASIVRAHSGSATAAPHEGGGTVVRIELPLLDSPSS